MEDLQKSLDTGNKQYPGGGGDWYKFQEGSNKMRILAFPAVLGNHYDRAKDGYKGVCIGKDEDCPGCTSGQKPTAKWLTYIHDHRTDEIAIVKFGYKIMEQLNALQKGEEYAFESFPMPYNIDIQLKDAGTLSAVYSVQASRKNTDVDSKLIESLENKNTPEQIVEAMKDKKVKELSGTDTPAKVEYPTEEDAGIDPDQIPF